MTNEVATTTPPPATVPAAQSQASSMLQMIAAASENPNVDVGKMQALVELQIKMMDKQAEIEFNQALNRLQSRLKPIQKTSEIDHGKDGNKKVIARYAKYEDIDRIIRPELIAEGFSISFRTDQQADGRIVVTGRLSHKDGHFREAGVPVSLDTGPGRSNVQAAGSTITYGKRYAVCMLLNIVTQDGLDSDTDGAATDALPTEKAAELDTLLREREKLVSADKRADVRPRFLAYMGAKDIQSILAKDEKKAFTAVSAIGGGAKK